MQKLLGFLAFLVGVEIAGAGVYMIMHVPRLALILSGLLAVIALTSVYDLIYEGFFNKK